MAAVARIDPGLEPRQRQSSRGFRALALRPLQRQAVGSARNPFRSSLWMRLGITALLLSGCQPHTELPLQRVGDLEMVDCRFQNNGHVHIHIARARGQATVVSRYSPGNSKSHSEALRSGLESEGRLLKSGAGEHRIELFLLNDHFGEKPGELLTLHIAADGRSTFRARGAGVSERIIDFGTCSRQAEAAGKTTPHN
jgi:hypothetical protein